MMPEEVVTNYREGGGAKNGLRESEVLPLKKRGTEKLQPCSRGEGTASFEVI